MASYFMDSSSNRGRMYLTLIRAAMKIDVAVRLEVIYDFSGDQ
jgi:hypothetical protein